MLSFVIHDTVPTTSTVDRLSKPMGLLFHHAANCVSLVAIAYVLRSGYWLLSAGQHVKLIISLTTRLHSINISRKYDSSWMAG